MIIVMYIIPIENSFYPVFLSCLSILPEPVPLRKAGIVLSASIQQFFQLFQVLGSLGVTGGHRLRDEVRAFPRITGSSCGTRPAGCRHESGCCLEACATLGRTVRLAAGRWLC